MSDGGWWVVETDYGLRVMYSSTVPDLFADGPYQTWHSANAHLEAVLNRKQRNDEVQDWIMLGWAAFAVSALVYAVMNWLA